MQNFPNRTSIDETTSSRQWLNMVEKLSTHRMRFLRERSEASLDPNTGKVRGKFFSKFHF